MLMHYIAYAIVYHAILHLSQERAKACIDRRGSNLNPGIDQGDFFGQRGANLGRAYFFSS
jgi:hypothetical protein